MLDTTTVPPDRILMETKSPGTAPVWLAHLLSETGVFVSSFSKYGACYRQNVLGHVTPEEVAKEVCHYA